MKAFILYILLLVNAPMVAQNTFVYNYNTFLSGTKDQNIEEMEVNHHIYFIKFSSNDYGPDVTINDKIKLYMTSSVEYSNEYKCQEFSFVDDDGNTGMFCLYDVGSILIVFSNIDLVIIYENRELN